uniref:Uncharacterized protein n=1 Tax=Aegilops tauschii subsp. strangulata TaxID=200361 RepID=A0A453S0E5_AEGTS
MNSATVHIATGPCSAFSESHCAATVAPCRAFSTVEEPVPFNIRASQLSNTVHLLGCWQLCSVSFAKAKRNVQ